jgi:hypothetical protein
MVDISSLVSDFPNKISYHLPSLSENLHFLGGTPGQTKYNPNETKNPPGQNSFAHHTYSVMNTV